MTNVVTPEESVRRLPGVGDDAVHVQVGEAPGATDEMQTAEAVEDLPQPVEMLLVSDLPDGIGPGHASHQRRLDILRAKETEALRGFLRENGIRYVLASPGIPHREDFKRWAVIAEFSESKWFDIFIIDPDDLPDPK